jgi:diguanylate cyclase (GGDEF)-like protein
VNPRSSDAEEVRNLRSRLADYAMAMDLLFRITESSSEDEAIDRVFDLFVDLCGPALILLVPIRDGAEGEPVWRPRSDSEPLEAMKAIRALKGDHGWTPSGKGFVLRIRQANSTVGVLLLDGLAAPDRREEYLNLALAATGVLALAVSNTRIHERLEKSARRDELTGVPNRRAVMERLTADLARSARYGEPLALLMFDIDDFKAVNDEFGHALGDQVLSAVARRLQEAVRTYDLTGRIGGEEFLVVAPHTDTRDAEQLAERIRRAVSALPVETSEGTSVTVTVSGGVAVSFDGTASLDELLSHADEALYWSKHRGRNVISAWSGPVP